MFRSTKKNLCLSNVHNAVVRRSISSHFCQISMLWCSATFTSWDTDVPVHYAGHLVVVIHVCACPLESYTRLWCVGLSQGRSCWWLGSCSSHSADCSGLAEPSVGIWLWLTHFAASSWFPFACGIPKVFGAVLNICYVAFW